MKRFIDKCYKCDVKVMETKVVKDGIKLNCLKCPQCGEEYFTSSELLKYDLEKGNRKMFRKFGTLGNSSIIRIPEKLVKELNIREGDYGYFEKREEGFFIKPISAKQL